MRKAKSTGVLGVVTGLGRGLSDAATRRRRRERVRSVTVAAGAAAVAALAGAVAWGVRGRGALTGRPLMSEKREGDGRIMVRHAVRVDRPLEEVYQYWHQFQNLPRFMRYLVSVQDLGPGRSRWTARGPAGSLLSWDVETTEDQPNELIGWRSLPGAEPESRGLVRFRNAPAGRGTEVILEVHYQPPAGAVGWTVAKVLGEEPGDQVREALRAFRQLLETGEIAQSDATVGAGRTRPAQPAREALSRAPPIPVAEARAPAAKPTEAEPERILEETS